MTDLCVCLYVAVPQEAEPSGACGGRSEAGVEAALQQEACHQGGVQGHTAACRTQGIPS